MKNTDGRNQSKYEQPTIKPIYETRPRTKRPDADENSGLFNYNGRVRNHGLLPDSREN